MTLVVDTSVIVAWLVDGGSDGTWAEQLVGGTALAAPHLMPAEATNILRRAAQAGDISHDVATLALHDLLDLRVEYFPFAPFATRVWELRSNVASYDAWYVSLAESLYSPLATLDRRLGRAPGPRCEFLMPGA